MVLRLCKLSVALILCSSTLAFPDDQIGRDIIRFGQMRILAGLPLEQQLSAEADWINTVFHYEPECHFAFWRGVSELECLKGMRALVDAFAKYGAIANPESVRVYISASGRWAPPDFNQRRLSLTLPYDATSAQIHWFLRSQLPAQAFRARESVLNQIGVLQSELSAAAQKRFEIDDDLTNLEALEGLYTLRGLQTEGLRFSDASEAVYIGRYFAPAHEFKLSIREDVPFAASASALREFFARESETNAAIHRWAENFLSERRKAEELARQIQEEFGLAQADCNGSSGVTARSCLNALWVLSVLFRKHKKPLPFDRVVVVGASAIATSAQYSLKNNRRTLLVQDPVPIRSVQIILESEGASDQ